MTSIRLSKKAKKTGTTGKTLSTALFIPPDQKIALKISNNKSLNMLERYQLKALGESKEFIEKAVTKHVQKEISEKITKESIETMPKKKLRYLICNLNIELNRA